MLNFTYTMQIAPDISPLTAAECAMVLGFQSLSQAFPVLRRENGVLCVGLNVPADVTLFVTPEVAPASAALHLAELLHTKNLTLEQCRTAEMPEDFSVASDYPHENPVQDWRTEKGLESIFAPGVLFEDTDGDLLSDSAPFHVVLPQNPDGDMLSAIIDFAYRLGMETTAYTAGIFTYEEVPGKKIRFISADACGIRFQNGDILIQGRGEALAQMVSWFCRSFPNAGETLTWEGFCRELVDALTWKTPDGQMSAALAAKETAETVTCIGSPDHSDFAEKLSALNIAYENHQTPVTEKVWDFTFPWEGETLLQLVKKAAQQVKPGQKVEVLAAVSENAAVRRSLWEQVTAAFPACGVEGSLLCAYKQGFSWLTEVIQPKLAALRVSNDDTITVHFAPFLAPGVETWQVEGGAVPSYNLTKGDPNAWMDLPIRFLQELYPADDILAQGLRISKDRIIFCADAQGETYRVTAEVGGQTVDLGGYTVPTQERPYLDSFPHLGKVHPAVGYVKVTADGVTVLEETFSTDTENVWDAYQSQVLPGVRDALLDIFGGIPEPEMQPLFGRLELECSLSEPDESLPSREDLLSSLDALHEELYFAGSDYFKNLGVQSVHGKMLDAPGLILPVIHNTPGSPTRFTATLSRRSHRMPCLKADGKLCHAPRQRSDLAVMITGLTWQAGKPGWQISVSGKEEPQLLNQLTAYGKLLSDGRLAVCEYLAGIQGTFLAGGRTIPFAVPSNASAAPLAIQDIVIPEDSIIGYGEYLTLIEQLKRVPRLRVLPLSHSTQNRVIYGVEVKSSRPGYYSRTKAITRNLSVMISARHHANEVSSTNAAFRLIQALLTEDAYQGLTERLNLTIIPLLNADGAAIHYRLQQEHPNWKFHVARYNALGREFGREFFNSDTIHTEANAHTGAWWRWLPDLVIDNHGVPSHEWEQQFSGYTAPSFKGFWLPRALLYGYFWYATNPEYKENLRLDKAMESAIADVINADPEITRWNHDWAACFERYAHGWLPGLFPADYYRDMINYWVAYPFTPGHTYDSVRYPWLTTCCYTSEVADETAQGEYLKLCQRTHLLHDRAILATLEKAAFVFDTKAEQRDNNVFFSMVRRRPVML